MLVDTIKKFNKHALIYYLTDQYSPNIDGINFRIEFEGDPQKIMEYRLNSFANAGIEEPAIYLDTDMLCCSIFNPARILGNRDICVCERSYHLSSSFNGNYLGLDFHEYDKQPFGKVYPYLACTTITKNSKVWLEIADTCNSLDEKFKIWYGDQEALKILAEKKPKEQIGFISEKKYACLPEENNGISTAYFIHFKGLSRKPHMVSFYKKIMGLIE